MPSRRRPATPGSPTETEGDSPRPARKRARLRSYSPAGSEPADSSDDDEQRPLKVYIVQAKLEPETITELYRLIEGFAPRGNGPGLQLELCSEVTDADVVVTDVHMRRRFERHVDWNIAVRIIVRLHIFRI